MDKNKKIILGVLTAALVILIIVLIVSKNSQPTEQVTSPGATQTTEPETGKSADNQETQEPNSEEAVRDKSIVQGAISQIDIAMIAIKDANGQEREFKIPTENAKFFQETEQQGAITLKEIGLFDMQVGSEAIVECNPETNEVISVKLLKE
ncbi:MAG: hypothetical protein PHQ20_03380 [Candidatus Moranbacteria bacterium]|jgi:mannitol-specific phosphotransferase system IIBC component|nr:hypothetical protein [Candidatus Moranbacteria bacterium]